MHRLRFHSQALSPVLSALPPVLETPHEVPPSQERDARLLHDTLLKEAPLHGGLEFSLAKVLSSAVTNTGSLLRAQMALLLGRAYESFTSLSYSMNSPEWSASPCPSVWTNRSHWARQLSSVGEANPTESASPQIKRTSLS